MEQKGFAYSDTTFDDLFNKKWSGFNKWKIHEKDETSSSGDSDEEAKDEPEADPGGWGEEL